jgi:hypothetical protein
VAAYGLIAYHTFFFRSIQETQCEWNKNIFGERGLGNWPQEINTTKISHEYLKMLWKWMQVNVLVM